PSGQPGAEGEGQTGPSGKSPHDQWYFAHANEMVHGIVKAPTLDLANRELIESHIHAEWLAAVRLKLASSIKESLDLYAEDYPVREEVMRACTDTAASERARIAAQELVRNVNASLDNEKDRYEPSFVDSVVDDAHEKFDRAFDRWRSLYRSTLEQLAKAHAIINNHAASRPERDNAQRLYNDAKRQLDVLLSPSASFNTDFYIYRYLASQGFLPGYSFPRLPLMAWIPARKSVAGKEEGGTMVSRPRFLGISEFGPRSLIYHDGKMYRVVKAKLGAGTRHELGAGIQLATKTVKVCPECGYGHLNREGDAEALQEVCEYCHASLPASSNIHNLYRVETVETTMVERITIKDEERQCQGYDLQTIFRLDYDDAGSLKLVKRNVSLDGQVIAELTYAPSATIWRINKGWKRRKDYSVLGFYINPITGAWTKEGAEDEDGMPPGADNGVQPNVPNQRIVPFVEDVLNILILRPKSELPEEAMATVQAALSRGIMQTYQIEEAELATEPLPSSDSRKAILFYEAAEGSAGVLSRLANAPHDMALVAKTALQIMHYDVDPARVSD
ncbi:MAG: DUF1998 domain-containing protein, partial [Rectinema subterraneum]|uniref:DUF1998 domain-containing protein n=1 Tax=Rectinema subterraneum TaxID=2653714 RepID=UPI003C7A10CE